jgi:hypothetical protein
MEAAQAVHQVGLFFYSLLYLILLIAYVLKFPHRSLAVIEFTVASHLDQSAEIANTFHICRRRFIILSKSAKQAKLILKLACYSVL